MRQKGERLELIDIRPKLEDVWHSFFGIFLLFISTGFDDPNLFNMSKEVRVCDRCLYKRFPCLLKLLFGNPKFVLGQGGCYFFPPIQSDPRLSPFLGRTCTPSPFQWKRSGSFESDFFLSFSWRVESEQSSVPSLGDVGLFWCLLKTQKLGVCFAIILVCRMILNIYIHLL